MTKLQERKIRLVHELMYQIKVSEVMTAKVVTFPTTATFREIQLCLKERRFSGTPIVDPAGKLVGMVSIDDIITAFDSGRIDSEVSCLCNRPLVTVPKNYSVIAASNLFHKYHYGRLPVVATANSDELVGILTFSDILSHLLVAINSIAERVEEQERKIAEIAEERQDSLHFELAPDRFDLAGAASTMIKRHLKEFGVAPPVIRRIAVVCYEAEMNVILHSLGGWMDVEIQPEAVHIVVEDEGPGIPDLDRALEAGFTTANEKIRALGFGAGMGLPNIKRSADLFSITSSMESGTRLEATIYLGQPVTQPVKPE